MSSRKVYIHTHEPILHMFYTEEEAISYFGEECVDELIDIPEELYHKFLRAKKDLYEASYRLKELQKI